MATNAQIQITSEMEQVIYGSVLGDGHLEVPPPGSVNWGLGIKHSLSQQGYALFKAALLGPLVSKVDYPTERVRVRTVRHPYLTTLAEEVIRENRKSVPARILSQLGPQGLAIWYLDDGNILWNRNHTNPILRLSTCAFTQEENEALRQMLRERFSVQAGRCSWKNPRNPTKPYEGIRICGDAGRRFLHLVQPFLKGTGLERKGLAVGVLA